MNSTTMLSMLFAVVLVGGMAVEVSAQPPERPFDQLFLKNDVELAGTVVIIREAVVVFRVDGESFDREFAKGDIRVILPRRGDPITFESSQAPDPEPEVQSEPPGGAVDDFLGLSEREDELREREERRSLFGTIGLGVAVVGALIALFG